MSTKRSTGKTKTTATEQPKQKDRKSEPINENLTPFSLEGIL